MTDHNTDPMFLAMQDSFKTKTEPVKTEPVKTEPVKTEPVKTEPVKTEPVKTEPVVLSFDEQLTKFFEEKTGGKYKTFEDIDKVLKTPQFEFANEKIKQMNDLAAKGIDVTSPEFLDAQNLDVENLKQVDDVLFEHYKRSEKGKGLSDASIKLLIKKDYDVETWEGKGDEELTPDDKLNQERMLRDGGLSKEWLKKFKAERTLAPQIDPVKAQEEQTRVENVLKAYEQDINNIEKETTKLSVPLKDKEGKDIGTFDFELSKEDIKDVFDGTMRQLPKGINALLNRFTKKDAGGQIVQDHKALALTLLKGMNFDKAVAAASLDSGEKKALEIEKASKNTNFTPNQAAGQNKQVFKNAEEAMAHAFQTQK